ncbi:MAG: Gmad2 immunoglobulin-like domain-containing protein, partial [Candidatus Limnocylindria bacterium]
NAMTNERDDEILGRALSRAIETLDAEETPYESSRMAARSAKRGTSFWRVSALAAAIVIAGALGSTLLERPATDEPVGQQPSPTVAPTNAAATTTPPGPTSTPKATAIDRQVIYFARDQLPPVAAHVDVLPVGSGIRDINALATAAERIGARMHALIGAGQAPAGTTNAMPAKSAVQSVSGVQIEGDLARVDLVVNAGNWQVSGAARSAAVLQQLVYTITEEPGIRRVLITQNGGKPTTIDQIAWDKALTREDVSGYGPVKDEVVSEDQSRPCTPNCPSPVPAVLSNNYSVDTFAAAVARFIVQVDSGDWESFGVSGRSVNDLNDPSQSKYQISIQVKGAEKKPGLEIVDRSPLRSIRSILKADLTLYELALDDQRPWRVALLPNPDRIVVDIGGFATSLSDTVAVYSPKPGDTGRQFTVSGLSRTYEATTQWRVVDSTRRELAKGFTTASRGTSAVWGTYQFSVQLPASVSGNVTLEVYWGSPRDGADTGLVQVPLTVR